MSLPRIKLKTAAVLLLVLGLLWPGRLNAQPAPTFEERMISSVLKNLARAYTAVADIDKIKKENVTRLRRMDEGKFKKKYAAVYDAIKDMPASIKEKYFLSENMSKDDAIMAIYLLDKKRLYEIIDAAPDTMLARIFKQHLARTKEKFDSSDIVVHIRKFWDNLAKSLSAKK